MKKYKKLVERFLFQHSGLSRLKESERKLSEITEIWQTEIQECFEGLTINAVPCSFVDNILTLEYNSSTDLFYLKNMESRICDILKKNILEGIEFRISYSKQEG